MHANQDVFSNTDDPYEYVRTTADGAIRLSTRQEWDAIILDADIRANATSGIHGVVRVRNEGNRAWDDQVCLVLSINGAAALEIPIAAEDSALPGFDGVYRGMPVSVVVDAPIAVPQPYLLTLGLTHNDAPFGEQRELSIGC